MSPLRQAAGRLLSSRKVQGAILGAATSVTTWVALALVAKFGLDDPELRKLALDAAKELPLVIAGLFGVQVLGQGLADQGKEAARETGEAKAREVEAQIARVKLNLEARKSRLADTAPATAAEE